jgi:isopropylmalate/homocitrate/citramalate synthase
VAHVTVSAIGERAGNVPLEDTVMSLKMLYGVDTGVKTEKFYELSKLVQKLSGFQLPPNRPIVGDSLLYIESGVVGMFHRRCRKAAPLQYMPFLPETVGRPGVDIALGKGSGQANIEEFLERRGKTPRPSRSTNWWRASSNSASRRKPSHGRRIRRPRGGRPREVSHVPHVG